MTITEQIIHLSRAEFWLIFSLASAAALAAFYFAFRQLAMARLIEDTPTTRIQFAQQGYVELNGIALPFEGKPLLAPLSTVECCWFHYKIEKKGNKKWRLVEQLRSSRPFLLQDGSGCCRIDPDGARVTTRERAVWCGNDRFPGAARRTQTGSGDTGWRSLLTRDMGLAGRYRYTEEWIPPNAGLYAIGKFKTRDEIDHQVDRGKKTREILHAWKRDKSRLLARFDRDRNGDIDQDEWQQARLAAAAEGAIESRRQLAVAAPHVLSDTGSANRPYLISTLPQFDLAKRFKLIAAGSIAAFFAAGGAGVWLLGTRFGG